MVALINQAFGYEALGSVVLFEILDPRTQVQAPGAPPIPKAKVLSVGPDVKGIRVGDTLPILMDQVRGFNLDGRTCSCLPEGAFPIRCKS
jgi:hypothetical protein